MKGASTYVLVLVVLVVFCETSLGKDRLIQVQIVHRHGAREHLRKNATHPKYENGPALLERGYEEAQGLGEAVRARYDSLLVGFREKYKGSEDIRAISSNLDRTMSTSRGFLEGFDGNSSMRTPSMVFGSTDADYKLRGYTLCKKYESKLEVLYRTDIFKEKAYLTEDLRQKYAKKLNEDPAIQHWFNVYDQIFLAKMGYTENLDFEVNEKDFQDIEDLAAFVEYWKYDYGVASHFPGAGLLKEMVDRAEAADEKKKNGQHRIIEYSAHYPTLLSLMTAMRIKNPKIKLGNKIPGFTAAIIWEVHQTDAGKVIKMIYSPSASKEDLSEREFCGIKFEYEGCRDNSCPLSTIKSENRKRMLGSKTFCHYCHPNSRLGPAPAFCFKHSDIETFTQFCPLRWPLIFLLVATVIIGGLFVGLGACLGPKRGIEDGIFVWYPKCMMPNGRLPPALAAVQQRRRR